MVQSDRVVVLTRECWRRLVDEFHADSPFPVLPYAYNCYTVFEGRLIVVLDTIGM